MKDLSLARAQPPRCATPYWPETILRCRSCRCIVTAPNGTLFQGVSLGQVAYAMSCPSHYCRSRVVALAERDAFDEARALAAEAELDAVYKRIGVT